MAKFSMQAPQINTEDLEDKEAIRRVQSYLYKLNEQLRYMMMNLDGENIQEGSIGETQLSRPVRQNIQNIEIKLGDQEQKSKTLADNFGNYYTKIETAQQIMTMMDDALGNYYTKIETASQISTMIGDALGDYSTTQQTAQAISQYVANNAYTQVSGITITSPGIEITGSQYVKIGTNGKLIITSGNFTISSIGGVSCTRGLFGNKFYINPNKIESTYIHIYDFDQLGDPPSQIALMADGQAEWAFSACSDGEIEMNGDVDVNGYRLSNGWIKDASVSGNTLTLTKYDGTTVNFNKAGAIDSMTLEAVTGHDDQFKAVAYDDANPPNELDSIQGEIYLDDTPANYSRSTYACVSPIGGGRIAYVPLSNYWDAAQSEFFTIEQTTLIPQHVRIRYTDGRVTVFYDDGSFEVYYKTT